MFAAAAGHSTLGIPQSVGQDFADATTSTKNLPARLGKRKLKGKRKRAK